MMKKHRYMVFSMKHLSIYFSFMFFITEISAQMIVFPQIISDFSIIDTSKYVIQYELKFIPNPDEPSIKEIDIIVLEIGDTISKSYSYNLFKHDSINTEAEKQGYTTAPLFQKNVPPVQVFKNYPKDKTTITYRSPFQGPVFRYIEDEIIIKWNIQPEKKNIQGYTCQKAIATFRGREWIAWFAFQIPILDGPWKFSGLPGLILEVYDVEKEYVFSCISLIEKKIPIKMFIWDYEYSTRKKILAFQKKAYENPVEYMKIINSKIRFIGKSETEAKNISYPFNPIELE